MNKMKYKIKNIDIEKNSNQAIIQLKKKDKKDFKI